MIAFVYRPNPEREPSREHPVARCDASEMPTSTAMKMVVHVVPR
jgi:hypothetical protein